MNFPVIPSLRRSLRLRCLDGRDGLAGSLVGGGPLPPPAPPPENNAIPLVHAKGVDLSTYVKRSYFHCLSRSRVERASPRHSRGIRRIRSLFSSSLLPANESLEGIRMCIYIYIYLRFKIVSNLDRSCVSNKLEHVSVLSSKRLNFEEGGEG